MGNFVNADATVTGPAPSTLTPQIAPFGDYGGPARTMPPLPGSPVINAATLSTITSDQRGFLVVGTPDSGAAEAGVIAVTTAVDELDSPIIGGTGISLREAITSGAATKVVFAPALDRATITLAASLGEIPLVRSLIVDGTGLPHGVTLDGGTGSNRIFNVTSPAPVTLTGLTLTGGEAPGGRGGAILAAAGTDLTLSRRTLTGNNAAEGGAIFSLGRLVLERCTLSANLGSYGGALQCLGHTTVTHCTISANNAFYAGGIFNKGTTAANPLTVAHSIIANNTATQANGKDIYNESADLTYDGFNNVRSDFADSNSTITFPPGSGVYRVDPRLAPLGDYGGSTRTMILTPDSIAKNTAIGSTSLSDQRGFPMVGVPDIGACEAGNANSYTTWAWDMTGSADAGPDDDPDKDDSTNFYEYATLTDPLVRNKRIEPGFDRTESQISTNIRSHVDRLTLKVRRNHENLIYTIENSETLTSWFTLATYDSANDKLDGSSSATATMDAGDVFTMRGTFGGGFAGKFFRVKFALQQ